MPAKFVNLIEFFELKIAPQIKMIGFIVRSGYCYRIILSLNAIYMAPDKKMAIGQGRNGDAGMVQGHIFRGDHSFFAAEQVQIGQHHQNMPATGVPFFGQKTGNANTEEKDYLYQAKEQIYQGQIGRNVFAGHRQNKDIDGHKQQTPEVNGTAIGLVYV